MVRLGVTRSFKVGIDLGTSNSIVAHLVGERPVIVPNGLGERLTPSVVSIDDDGSILVGAAAAARRLTHPDRTAFNFKLDMGGPRRYRLGRREFRPEQLSAFVLASLKRDAEAILGGTIDEAVVTVPAHFGEMQRRATRVACDLAELNVERIINEPTAAALAYGLHGTDREHRVVVLDLGGGTFDVTVLEILEGVVEVQASAGDARLGGEDFAAALRQWALLEWERASSLGEERLDALRPAIASACEMAKQRLSQANQAAISFVDDRDGLVELAISRRQAEMLWLPFIERMRGPIVRALNDAGVAPREIDEVLLVGGASRMPCVQRFAREMFGQEPNLELPPDEAVALGAAVQMGLKDSLSGYQDLVATDIAPFTLGVAVSRRLGERHVDGFFHPIIERGTVLPASRSDLLHTVADGQREVVIDVYQGEHPVCEDNDLLGTYHLRGIPPARAGQEGVEVRFTYDLNGLLEIDAKVLSTGADHQVFIDRSSGNLSPEEVERAREAMQRLKLHPRETLPNVTALARASALYTQLVGRPRAELGDAIAQFQAALDGQDPDEIAYMRDVLIEMTAAFRRLLDH